MLFIYLFSHLNLMHWSSIFDVTEAYLVAIKGATAKSHGVIPQTSIQEKRNAFFEHLHTNQTTVVLLVLFVTHPYLFY
jgi:hypothetical protein